jgi:hypothetical protein
MRLARPGIVGEKYGTFGDFFWAPARFSTADSREMDPIQLRWMNASGGT